MFSTIIVIVLLLASIASFFGFLKQRKDDDRVDDFAKIVLGAIAAVTFVGAVVVLIASTFFTNGVQQAKVKVNFDGTIAGVVTDPGAGFKAPWTKLVEFDLSSQSLTFAGNKEDTPSYSGGKVNGGEITAAVKGGSQSNFDLQLTYNIEAKQVKEIYTDYRSQENFSSQVIVPKVLSAARKIPAQYDAISFRGEKQGEAQEGIIESSNDALAPFGVKFTVGALQNIRYSDDVEKSIQNVQVAQQQQQKAEAELQATEISSQQQIVQAKAKAKANDILTKSLSPQILQQRYIDALGKGSVYVVPEGSTPLVTTK